MVGTRAMFNLETGSGGGRVSRLTLLRKCEEWVITGSGSDRICDILGVIERGML